MIKFNISLFFSFSYLRGWCRPFEKPLLKNPFQREIKTYDITKAFESINCSNCKYRQLSTKKGGQHDLKDGTIMFI